MKQFVLVFKCLAKSFSWVRMILNKSADFVAFFTQPEIYIIAR
jgi:hypothetical protein